MKSFGGIAVFLEEYLIKSNAVEWIKTENEDVIWLRFNKKFLNSNCHLYIGCTYLNPSNKVQNDICFSNLRKDIEKFASQGFIMILGDLNARIGTSHDFINISNDVNCAEPNSEPVTVFRNSEDKVKPNKRGKELLSLCKELDISVLNGRKAGDMYGKITCFRSNGCSVVDYGLCSNDFIKNVLFFKVGRYMPWISDHCGVQLLIGIDINGITKCLPDYGAFDLPIAYKWNENSTEKLTEIFKKANFKTSLFSINEINDPDFAVSKFNELVYLACTEAKLNKYVKKHYSHKHNKPWFGNDCQVAKDKIRSMCNELKSEPTNLTLRSELAVKRKQYKSLLRRCKRAYSTEKLQNMSASAKDPKSFWKQFTSFSEHKGPDLSSISHHEALNHFSSLLGSGGTLKVEKSKLAGPLDSPFTFDELHSARKRLKAGKSCGIDGIGNEILCCLYDVCPEFFFNLFNNILVQGKFPSTWTTSLISPVHKGGSPYDILNFRGISLTPCISKFFTTILNNRLIGWCTLHKILSPLQLGFIKGNRTSDAHIILQNLIDKYCYKRGRKIYSAFVDFEKAFDKIPRLNLFSKLLKVGVTGNFFNIIASMYSNNTARVKLSNKMTLPFSVTSGVRQGCVLSPTLFNIFMSDLCKTLLVNGDDCLQIDSNSFIPCLLWADDIVLLSLSKSGLQQQIDKLEIFAESNNLIVNSNKTKCMCFNKRGILIKNYFTYKSDMFEDVHCYKYLGFIVSCNGNLTRGIKDLNERANKAYHLLKYTLGLNFRDDIQISLKLFDSLIKPILLYNSDFWGMSKMSRRLNITEKVANTFYKSLLGVSYRVSNFAVMMELNRYPISFDAQKNCLNNWVRISHQRKANSLLLLSYQNSIDENLRWPLDIKDGLANADMGFIWESSLSLTPKSKTTKLLVQNLTQNLYKKKYELFESTDSKYNLLAKLRCRDDSRLPFYLINEKKINLRILLSKLRLSDLHLQIEIGRFFQICRQERVCSLCCNGVEDELHVLFDCDVYSDLRTHWDTSVKTKCPELSNLSDIDMLYQSLQTRYATHELGSFLYLLMERRASLLNCDE